jgi:predicted phosphodiesterase
MMIFMLGDVHGKFKHVERVVDEHRPTAIILLGDIEAEKPLHEILERVMGMTEVYWIPGNHDTDNQSNCDNLFGSTLIDRNLHGRVVEIAGLRVAGLGGVFRGEIWMPDPATAPAHFESHEEYAAKSEPGRILAAQRRRATAAGKPEIIATGKMLKHRSTIFYRDWFDLYGQQADILVTHEAPSCHQHGFSVIDDLARSMHVKFAFHGHHHKHLDYEAKWKELGFRAYGVGFRAVTDMYGEIITVGEHDYR